MALIIQQQPSTDLRIRPGHGDVIFIVGGGTLTNTFRHKYVAQIYMNDVEGDTTPYGQQNIVATLKAPANAKGFAVFNIANILSDNCSTDTLGIPNTLVPGKPEFESKFNGVGFSTKQHSIHQIDSFAGNRKNFRRFFVQFREEFATSATGNVAITGQINSEIFSVTNAVEQLEDGFESFDWLSYIPNGTSKKFLSTMPSTIDRKWRKSDFGLVAFFQGKFDLSDNTKHSGLVFITFKLYDSSNSLLATINHTLFSNTIGGTSGQSNVSLDYHDALHSYNTVPALFYAGVGFNNIEIKNGTQSADTSYYTIQGTGILGTVMTETITVRLTDDDCKGFETIRLAYVNSLGTWDYYNFYKKSTKTTQLKKTYYKSNYGDYQGRSYDQISAQGGKRALQTVAEEMIEANTDYITEAEATALKELFISPQVYMQVGTGTSVQFVPVCVEEKEYIKQTSANDMLMQYVIQIKKGHNTRVQTL
tara:strand:+ start:662 stop:2092 length:1431 start_codon:yes stop_codon:yes gene_type:complete